METYHVPVLVKEVVENMELKPNGVYIDCTLGGGGHSRALLEAEPSITIYGFDQDEAAIRHSKKVLHKYIKKNVFLFNENFRTFRSRMALEKVSKADGILYDIGVSQHQINDSSRGFSYAGDSKLDMRMNKSSQISAFEIINTYSQDQLQDLFFRYGEERHSKKIASNIIKTRENGEVKTTKQLADIIEKNVPPCSRQDLNKSKSRIFQAVRIEVNNELEALEASLKDAISILKPGGRLLVISWHSLEDRIVKECMKRESNGCVCPREIPNCVCNIRQRIKIINKKPIIPSEAEISLNSNARSAKLRVGERI